MPLATKIKKESEKFSQSYLHKMIDGVIIDGMIDNTSNYKKRLNNIIIIMSIL